MVQQKEDTDVGKEPQNSDLVKRDRDMVVSGPRRWPELFIVTGKGSRLTDANGNSYTDLTAGGTACNVGHNNDSVIKAIYDQAEALVHVGYQSAAHRPEVELAGVLRSIAPHNLSEGKVAFTNSGSEAIDVALRIAMLSTKRHVFLTYQSSHHGSSIAGSWVSGDIGLREGIAPRGLDVVFLPYPYCYRCPLGLKYEDCELACIEYVRRSLARDVHVEEVACLLLEPVQQAAGIIVPPKEYFGEIGKLCREHEIMMIDDEVATGLGRTGRMFGLDNFGISANMLTLGKPLASGMPLGAVIGEEELMSQAAKSIHALESGAANPICCAASIESIRLIRENNLEKRAAAMGEEVMRRLRDLGEDVEGIGEVRGLGLMIGVELVKNRRSKEPDSERATRVVREAAKSGVLIDRAGPHKNVLKITPPLNIPAEDMTRSIDVVEKILVKP